MFIMLQWKLTLNKILIFNFPGLTGRWCFKRTEQMSSVLFLFFLFVTVPRQFEEMIRLTGSLKMKTVKMGTKLSFELRVKDQISD